MKLGTNGGFLSFSTAAIGVFKVFSDVLVAP
jgi:hypothetical protein